MENQREPMQSESIAKLAEALSKAQGSIKGAAKDTENPFFKSRYADLASVWDACREALTANGLSVIQTTDDGVEGVTVITTLAHSSGEWMRGRLTMKPVKNDPQGIGSTITYARRYALAAMVGVAPEDDDGNSASGRQPNGTTVAASPQAAAKPAWHGPMAKMKLKDKLNSLTFQIRECYDLDELVGLWEDHQEYLVQAKIDLPDYYQLAVDEKERKKTGLTNNDAAVAA
jgi:hypothetical protein